jgi:cyclophilin family peptidyl-prolyl cis-trans isomerase
VAKRRKTRKCPVCKQEIKADRLESHLRTAHPAEAPLPKEKGRSGRKALPAILWPALAVIVVVVVASVGIYYIDKPSSEEEGTNIDNTTPSNSVYATKYARFTTASGVFTVELYGNETPNTVANFINIANMGWYSQTIFHRIAKSFVIQGGGFTQDGFQTNSLKVVPLSPIKLEINKNVKNWRSYIAMARTTDPDSATTQFFINLVDNSANLGPGGYSTEGYAAFGKVISGMDVVDGIAANTLTQTPAGSQEQSSPLESQLPQLVINSVSILDTASG